MPVPFEALIPYAIITVMFGVSGAGLSKLRNMQNSGLRPRRSVDQWDNQSMSQDTQFSLSLGFDVLTFTIVMDRDRRLTGLLRGQTANATAPAGFEVNNAWKVEKRFS